MALVLGVALCLGAAGCRSSTPQATSPRASQALTIVNFAYHPNPITVNPGAVIAVTNRDDTDHTVTALDGAFNTGNIAPTTTVTFTAPRTPGNYRFECLIHPKMLATLVVR